MDLFSEIYKATDKERILTVTRRGDDMHFSLVAVTDEGRETAVNYAFPKKQLELAHCPQDLLTTFLRSAYTQIEGKNEV